MLNSKERINFISKYISAYRSQIELSNSRGLFDSAKLFETFACKLCNLWFRKEFNNLNEEIPNFPYFDLVSKDGELFVQVSTTKDIPTKIKSTLEKIKESKKEEFSKIKKAVFFVLSNDSVDKVVDYCGDNQIGNISFSRKDNLITTNDIISKAESDLDFQKSLYALLKKDFEDIKNLSDKLNSKISFSKSAISSSIDCLINGEYEIDRSQIINQIKNASDKFVCVEGGPGSGKSVICKKVIEDKDNVLFVRAEKIAKVNHLSEIWDIDIEKAIKFLGEQSLYIFIDSLEFIADASKSQIDLLYGLYDLASKSEKVFIITSCRSSDKSTFVKLNSNYNVKSVELEYISTDELNAISQKYPVILAMKDNQHYSTLLRSPFYINFIVSKIKDINNIEDETQIRDLIWNNVICLKEKASEHNLVWG